MLYTPPISDYKPFYIQFATGYAQDIRTAFSVVVKTHDYPSALKVKEPYKNQWKDEDGDEEYMPQGGLKYEAFTFKMECVMFAYGASIDTAITDLKSGVRAFQNALSAGFMRTYDAWTGFGFREVRLQEFSAPPEDAYQAWGNGVRVIFSVTLKVNDPRTSMKYSAANNLIVEG